MAHGHCHHHGDCSHNHEDTGDPAVIYSLYNKIDIQKVQCFNEHEEEAGKRVFKPWDQRLDTSQFVESDVDEELLFYIPFTGNMKLKGLVLFGGEGGQHPNELRLFKNRPPLGFDQLGGEPDQVIPVTRDSSATIDYPLKTSRFNGVSNLTIYIPGNHGDETTVIYYIGLRGDYTEAHRHEVTIATYEASPNPADHKSSTIHTIPNSVS